MDRTRRHSTRTEATRTCLPSVALSTHAKELPRKAKVKSRNSVGSVILLLTACFPNVSPFSTPFDTQPYCLIAAGVIVLARLGWGKSAIIPKILLPSIFVVVVAVLYFLSSSISLLAIRSLFAYMSVALISIASYWVCRDVSVRWFHAVVFIWLIVGLIQQFIYRYFGAWFIVDIRTTDNRGVTGLAVEPSYYALFCIFFLMLNEFYYCRGQQSRRARNAMAVLLLVQIFFAKSGLGFLALIIWGICEIITRPSFQKRVASTVWFLVIGIGCFFVLAHTRIFGGTRIAGLLNYADSGDLNALATDGSIAARLAHMIVSITSLSHNYGFGFGLGTWSEYAASLADSLGSFLYSFLNLNSFPPGDRLMSGWGTGIYELGWYGLMLPVSFLLMLRVNKSSTLALTQMSSIAFVRASGICIFTLMWISIPLAFPLFGYTWGVLAAMREYEVRPTLQTDLK